MPGSWQAWSPDSAKWIIVGYDFAREDTAVDDGFYFSGFTVIDLATGAEPDTDKFGKPLGPGPSALQIQQEPGVASCECPLQGRSPATRRAVQLENVLVSFLKSQHPQMVNGIEIHSTLAMSTGRCVGRSWAREPSPGRGLLSSFFGISVCAG